MEYDAEEIAGVFGRAAAAYDTVIPFFSRFGARLVGFAGLQEGERVLDLGSGRGATLLPAAERVGSSGHVLGVDLSEEMVGLLTGEIERRGLTNATARRVDAGDLDVASDSFDAAVSSFVLHLLPRPGAAAAELRRVLVPGGRLAASAPTGASRQWDFLMQLFRRFASRATQPIPIPFRADFDLASLLASTGFEVVATAEEQIEFHFADEQAWWAWAWSHGMRALFEALPPADLDELRQEASSAMAALRTPRGFPMNQSASFVLARTPSPG